MFYVYRRGDVGFNSMSTAEGDVGSCCMCTGRVVSYVYRRRSAGLYCVCTAEGL